MNKISNYLKSFAIKNWQKYSFKKEWASIICLLLVLKLATSAVSIFSGFFYLDNFFFSFTDSETASKIFSFITLFIIEGLCTLFLAKFFKFALRVEFKTAALPLVCAVMIFAISFVVSCNGIALFASQSEDLSKLINAKYNSQITELKNENSLNIKQLENYIETIKTNPENWSGGKRCVLSEYQNREIAKTYDLIATYKNDLKKQLQSIENLRNNELAENSKNTTDKSDKYYNIVAFIMLIQVVCSGGLWFFWCKISAQDSPENDYKESVNDIYNQANTLIDNGLNICIEQKFSTITTAFNQLANDLRMKEINAATAAKIPEKTEKKRAGFAVETTETETDNNATTHGVSAVKSVNLTPSDNVYPVAVCAECGNELTASQIARKAKFCCPSCRVRNYNKMHPERKDIILKDNNLKH